MAAATTAAAAFRQMRSWIGSGEKADDEAEDVKRPMIDRHRLVNFDLEKVSDTRKVN